MTHTQSLAQSYQRDSLARRVRLAVAVGDGALAQWLAIQLVHLTHKGGLTIMMPQTLTLITAQSRQYLGGIRQHNGLTDAEQDYMQTCLAMGAQGDLEASETAGEMLQIGRNRLSSMLKDELPALQVDW